MWTDLRMYSRIIWFVLFVYRFLIRTSLFIFVWTLHHLYINKYLRCSNMLLQSISPFLWIEMFVFVCQKVRVIFVFVCQKSAWFAITIVDVSIQLHFVKMNWSYQFNFILFIEFVLFLSEVCVAAQNFDCVARMRVLEAVQYHSNGQIPQRAGQSSSLFLCC